MNHHNVDLNEVSKFSTLAAHWWDPEGELKTLHQINPLRLKYIDEKAQLKGKNVIDIGCGAGLLAEGIAKRGANVTGVDMSQEAIKVAKLHQHESKLEIDYIISNAEKIASERPARYDVVTCLELLEHVPDPISVIQACAALVKPNGHVFFSTLNRNLKAYLFAIIGAEHLLKLLPKGTHDYGKFIRPSELAAWARKSGLITQDIIGIQYQPFTKEFTLGKDTSVNYLMSCQQKM